MIINIHLIIMKFKFLFDVYCNLKCFWTDDFTSFYLYLITADAFSLYITSYHHHDNNLITFMLVNS